MSSRSTAIDFKTVSCLFCRYSSLSSTVPLTAPTVYPSLLLYLPPNVALSLPFKTPESTSSFSSLIAVEVSCSSVWSTETKAEFIFCIIPEAPTASDSIKSAPGAPACRIASVKLKNELLPLSLIFITAAKSEFISEANSSPTILKSATVFLYKSLSVTGNTTSSCHLFLRSELALSKPSGVLKSYFLRRAILYSASSSLDCLFFLFIS